MYSSKLFGIPTQETEANLVIIPVPWEVTTSYGGGTSNGPKSILKASPQLDLYTYDENETILKNPIYLCQENEKLIQSNFENKKKAQALISYLEKNNELDETHVKLLSEVNLSCQQMNDSIHQQSLELLKQNKKVGVIGGDHSSPLGLIKALSLSNPVYDILHIDAHLDLRKSYQGFKYSHASIMYNVLQLDNPPQNIVSVGIRDYCNEEMSLVRQQKNLTSFTDENIQNHLFKGGSWKEKADKIVSSLTHPTYISFDIDGLDPKYCPHTGTPVPGGLSFNQAKYLIERATEKNKVIGFDLCEVSPSNDPSNEWDGNVGSRVLFLLCKSILNE